ncbi:LptA/OstA family protein [Pelagibius marinus]|uniref:LptA/OstA family protein n=1 Tax=Pelagibius marinus TaxID=2762760 RepID=UPI0018723D57|nr:LptA/OstA family protein [Pelagibius marinus]
MTVALRLTARPRPVPAEHPMLAAVLTTALAAALMLGLAALPLRPAAAQSTAAELRESDEPLEINAEEGIEWNRNDKTYVARGNARAASGEVEVLADVLTAYYREREERPAGEDSLFSQGGGSEIYLLEAAGNVRINSPEGSVFGDKGQYKLEEKVFIMTGEDLRLISKEDVVTARDSLEYWEGQRKAVARGKAHATHEDKQIKADVLTANFEENAAGDLEVHRIDAAGNVEIMTAKEYARGREGVYYVKRELATLEGDVKITQGENQLDGDYAEVNMATGISKLLGAPPGSKDKPRQVKALVLPRATKEIEKETSDDGAAETGGTQ